MQILELQEVGNMGNAFFKSSQQTCTCQNQKRKKQVQCTWLTSSIKLQIRERDRIKLFAIKNNSAYYWNAYKLSRNRVTQALREAKSAYYKDNL